MTTSKLTRELIKISRVRKTYFYNRPNMAFRVEHQDFITHPSLGTNEAIITAFNRPNTKMLQKQILIELNRFFNVKVLYRKKYNPLNGTMAHNYQVIGHRQDIEYFIPIATKVLEQAVDEITKPVKAQYRRNQLAGKAIKSSLALLAKKKKDYIMKLHKAVMKALDNEVKIPRRRINYYLKLYITKEVKLKNKKPSPYHRLTNNRFIL